MGGCVSVAISCDKVIDNLTSCLSGDKNPFFNLRDNVTTLRETVRQLEARRDDLLRRTRVQEDRGLSRLSELEEWFSEVESTVRESHALLSRSYDEENKLCCCRYCSMRCISSFGYGKMVVEKIKEVRSLISRGVFDKVAQEGPIPKVEEKLFHQKIVGQAETIESTVNSIMEDMVNLLGIYGMGGVGKTTLLSQINNKFLTKSNDFDIVIWIVVSKTPTVHRIQEEIGKRLDLCDRGWERRTEEEIASIINRSLKSRRYVLLLDDIWTKVDLAKIGIPDPKRNKSKIVFTTRSSEVCGRMGVDKEIEIKSLMWDDAWELFSRNMKETLESHTEIPEVAKTIARKCNGLPLALTVISETMARKNTIEEWRAAVSLLSSQIEVDVLSILKFSYDDLKSEKTKSCFLFCAMFPEDYEIGKDDLIEYWVGQGYIPGCRGINYKGYEIIGTLIRAYLLKENETKETVKMHDVVREMALWISSGSDDQQKKNVVVVEANAQLRDIPKIEDKEAVSCISLIYNQIEEACEGLHCPNLKTLLLRDNRLRKISSGFFSHLPVLAVLDLSLNPNLIELPNLSRLVSLEQLNLSCTGILRLPNELSELRELVYLNLEHTYMLTDIAVISSLPNLHVLRLYASGVEITDELVTQIQAMTYLDLLTITLRNSSGLESFTRDKRFIDYNESLNLNECSGPLILPLATISSSRFLEIQDSHILKIQIAESIGYRMGRVRNPIATLYVVWSPDLEHIISESEYYLLGDTCQLEGFIAFRELEFLTLENLCNLESIYWKPLLFGKLKEIKIKSCPKLERLPLDSNSACNQNVVIKAEEEWLKAVIWEDEATKERFSPI